MKKYLAEALGTMMLVLMCCGTHMSLACTGCAPVALICTALASGLAFTALACTIGGISGCHINPAVTTGAFLSGRIGGKDAAMYIVSQATGGIAAAAILCALAASTGMTDIGANCLRGNGAATFPVPAGLLAEAVCSCVLVFVFLGATSRAGGATDSAAGLAVGFAYVVVSLCCARYTGASVNPARSLGTAIFSGGAPLAQLWIFIVGPAAGGTVAALLWKAVAPAGK